MANDSKTYADANLAAFVRTCLSKGISVEQAERLIEMTFEEVEAWEKPEATKNEAPP